LIKIHHLIQTVTIFVLCCVSKWATTICLTGKETLLKNNMRQLKSVWNNIVKSKNISFRQEYPIIGMSICYQYFVCGEMYSYFEFAKELHDTTLVPYLENEHKYTLEVKLQLAKAYCQLGDSETALAIAKEVLDRFINVYGECHPKTINVVKTIVYTMSEQSKLHEALVFLMGFLSKNGDQLEPITATELKTAAGLIFLDIGNIGSAKACFSNSLSILHELLKEDRVQDFVMTTSHLAKCYDCKSEFENQYELLQKSLLRLAEFTRTNDLLMPTIALDGITTLKLSVARNCRLLGKTEEFFAIVDDVITSANADSMNVMIAKILKAKWLTHNDSKSYAEGLVTFEEALHLCRMKFGSGSMTEYEVRREILRTKFLMGDKEESLSELDKLHCALESQLGEAHAEVSEN